MADVTISQLTRGTPTGNSLLPYSTGSNTLGVPVSALFQNAGNIGIGTTNPTASLSVCGSAVNAYSTPGVHLGTTAGFVSVGEYGAVQINGLFGAYIDFSNSNPAKDYDFRIIFNKPGDINKGLGIYSDTNSLMYMKRTGEVGVGTDDPQTRLDVRGLIGTVYTSNVTVAPNTTVTVLDPNGDYNTNVYGHFNQWVYSTLGFGSRSFIVQASIVWDTGNSSDGASFLIVYNHGINSSDIKRMDNGFMKYRGDTFVSGGGAGANQKPVIRINNQGDTTLTPKFCVQAIGTRLL